MKFLDSLTSYSSNSWAVTDEKKLSELDPDNFDSIESAEVVEKEQDWGMSTSICMYLNGGKTRKYLSLSNQSDLEVGDEVDLDSITVLKLEREGNDPIYRGDGEIKQKPSRHGRSKK